MSPDVNRRSQAGFWLLPPMLLYMLDRAWQNISTWPTHVASAKMLKKPKSLTLRLAKPPGWSYSCGQYARLCVPRVSQSEWHPFSICSAPHQDHIEFFIKAGQRGRAA